MAELRYQHWLCLVVPESIMLLPGTIQPHQYSTYTLLEFSVRHSMHRRILSCPQPGSRRTCALFLDSAFGNSWTSCCSLRELLPGPTVEELTFESQIKNPPFKTDQVWSSRWNMSFYEEFSSYVLVEEDSLPKIVPQNTLFLTPYNSTIPALHPPGSLETLLSSHWLFCMLSWLSWTLIALCPLYLILCWALRLAAIRNFVHLFLRQKPPSCFLFWPFPHHPERTLQEKAIKIRQLSFSCATLHLLNKPDVTVLTTEKAN